MSEGVAWCTETNHVVEWPSLLRLKCVGMVWSDESDLVLV